MLYCKSMLRAILLALLPLLLYAQEGKLRGKVTDKESREALVGANVMIEGTTLGAATDVNGEYIILTVPAGVYSVKVSYIGYAPVTISNIRVSATITTTQDFQLSSSSVQVQAVEIVAERPLIQRNTTNTVRITQAEEIQSLPFRNVQNIVALDAGAVQQGGSLYIRGGRAGEVAYYVDGANATNPLYASENYSSIRDAIEEVQLQTGGMTAELGGAMSGVVRTTTRTGGSQLRFSFDYLTDDFAKPGKQFLGTSPFGYRNAVATVSGPVTSGVRFFLAGQHNFMRDDHPMFLTPFTFSGIVDDGLNIANNAGKELPGPISFVKNYLYDNWTQINTGQGNVVFDLKELADVPLKLRVNGYYDINTSINGNSWPGIMTYTGATYFRKDARDTRNETITYAGSVKLTHIINPTTFYEVGVSMQFRKARTYDKTFGDNWMSYMDSAANANAGFPGVVNPWSSRYTAPPAMSIIQKFLLVDPDNPNNAYNKNQQNMIGANVDLTSQVNSTWELKAGGNIESWVMRSFAINQIASLLTFLDPNKDGVFDADNIVYGSDITKGTPIDERLKRIRWENAGDIRTYGYDYKGNSTDGYNVPGVSSKVDAPYKPTFAAAYVQNKFEFNDLILNVGLRYEYMDPKMLMVDPTLNEQTGQYDYQDVPVDQNLNIIPEDDFTTTKAFSFLLPRISFSFPVSDKTVFYTQYGKYVQMPSLNQLYDTENRISNALNPLTRSFTGGNIGFTARPERTTLFEIGIRQVLTQNLAFTLTGFYKDTKEQLQLRRVYNSVGNPIFTSYQNTDFGTVKGVELTLELRRTERLQARINYTLSDARGTGASSASNAVATTDAIKARFPNFVATQPFDQTHRGTILLDYRFAKGDAGPVLEGLGINLLMSFNSGHPYTKIEEPLNLGQASPWNIGVYALRDARFRNPVEPVNSSTTPWVFNMDLNLSKMIYLGSLNVEIYANVLNVLNSKQIIDVYPNTGTPYDDGWLKSPFAQPYKEIPNYEAFYRAINLENRWGVMTYRGDVYSAPRQIRVGARIEM
jgi:hypothetical protein